MTDSLPLLVMVTPAPLTETVNASEVPVTAALLPLKVTFTVRSKVTLVTSSSDGSVSMSLPALSSVMTVVLLSSGVMMSSASGLQPAATRVSATMDRCEVFINLPVSIHVPDGKARMMP